MKARAEELGMEKHPTDRRALLRQARVLTELYVEFFDRLLHEKGPMVRGSFGIRWRRCGRAGCRCAQGERHPACYLSVSVNGRLKQLHVPAEEERRLKRAVDRYRAFRQARRQLEELHAQHLALIDACGAQLLEPYLPPSERPPAGEPKKARQKKAPAGTP